MEPLSEVRTCSFIPDQYLADSHCTVCGSPHVRGPVPAGSGGAGQGVLSLAPDMAD